MATIEKRIGKAGDAQYRVKVRMRGHKPASATFDRITDAKRWAAETETRIREGRYFDQAEARRHTLADLIDRYLAETLPVAKIRGKRERELHLRMWREKLGHITLADLTAPMIHETRSKMLGRVTRLKRPVSNGAINRQLMVLASLLTTAVKDYGWLDDSPMRKLSKLSEPRGRVRFLSDAERDALLRECQAHSALLHAVVVCALATGARRGELLGLRWPDVDMQRSLMTFQQTKNGERRTVPIVGLARDLLVEHRKVRRLDTDLVFPGDTGKPLEVGKMFREACERAGIADFRFHDLRHTAASWIAMNGGTLAEIAEVLGHKTLQMVRRYTHLTEGHTRGVLERMNKRAFGK
ncbi:MAG: site-specific integrase [Proteobacteria bacterium]|uniref:tyrosine-type recombinase/integrase n=1 Tax=Rudaea sp. TaxID=2136325 RepID=UPI00378340E0|nr:site-specific integrase [Pseudomonadota bacterium]